MQLQQCRVYGRSLRCIAVYIRNYNIAIRPASEEQEEDTVLVNSKDFVKIGPPLTASQELAYLLQSPFQDAFKNTFLS